MKICIVTGGAGFIGSHLVDALIKLGHQVKVVDNFYTGKKENVNSKAELVEIDICDQDLSAVFAGTDVVFHLAAIVNVQHSIENPLETNRVNIDGTTNILEACRKNNVRRLVATSSAAVYGNQKTPLLQETQNPAPLSPYGLQKLVNEYYCQLYSDLHGLQTVSLRYLNVYGPRQSLFGGYAALVPRTITRLLNNEPAVIYGNGRQTRDFIYVKDVVAANIAAGFSDKILKGQVFNVGTGKETSVNEMVKAMTNASGENLAPEYLPPLIEPRNARADTTKIQNLLGWRAQTELLKGVQETYKWYKSIKE